jgi:hypothetical protein
MEHERGHAGVKSLVGGEEFRKIRKETPLAGVVGFEELRQRTADIERIHGLGPQAMHSKEYRKNLDDADFFAKSISTNLAAATGKSKEEVIQSAKDYNAKLNSLAESKLKLDKIQEKLGDKPKESKESEEKEEKVPSKKIDKPAKPKEIEKPAKSKEKDETLNRMAPADL